MAASESASSMIRHLIILLLLLLPILLLLPSFAIGLDQAVAIRRSNEMLVPLNSTTALICEPVFNQGRPAEEEEARWMRDGREVARVSGRTNAILLGGGSAVVDQPAGGGGADPIPEIGFLLIRHTRREDEGEYWCERIGDGQQGERTRLRVAFLEPFPAGARPSVAKESLLIRLDCPKPSGVPPPIISWQFNGERLVDFSALNLQMAANGSLLIHNFSAHQSGFYACEAVNFVGRHLSEPIFLPVPSAAAGGRRPVAADTAGTAFVDCLSAYVRNGVLWFLIGCLTTSCVVLAYILGALFLYRLYALRDRQHHRWPRTLFAGPGFRKVVAPMAERGRMAGGPPPAYESPESSTTTTRSGGGGEQFDV